MKKRAATPTRKKGSPKARRAAKPSTARAAVSTKPAPRTPGAGAYTPSPLKSDGWPPFRYPLQ